MSLISTANTTNQQYSANLFTDISARAAHNTNVLPTTTSNIAAANASKMMGGGLPFLHNGLIKGGINKRRKTINKRRIINRQKINKISNKYKMRGSRKQIRRIKSRLLRRTRRTRNNRGSRTRRRRSRGGMHSVAANASYSTGGILGKTDSAMANPVPFIKNDVNSFDAYNHFP